jgi:hypothetical protein
VTREPSARRAMEMRATVRGSLGCVPVLTLAVAFFVSSGHAQSSPGAAQHPHKKPKPAPPLITESSPQPAPPPAAPPVLTPEQMPPRVPEISWDGKLLSINAENSTLSDILTVVRARTGAVIDMPTGAGRERMAARLGPAPVREVLSSLLSGTDYDYIIQASETDEYGIQSVTLTPRGKGEDLVASANPSTSGIRRPPGYTASGKHTFEVMPDTGKDKEAPPSQDVASAEEGQAAQPAEAGGTESASASAQPGSADTQAPSDASSNTSGSLASSETPQVGRGALPGVDPSGSQSPTVEQMVQGMQQLYEQRRQLQIQQNQAQQNHAPSN